MITDDLKRIIASASGVPVEKVTLEHPQLEDHGDYSTNIALVLKGGRKLAEEIADKIKGDFIDNVEVAGPGFINFFLKKSYLVEQLDKSVELEKPWSGKKVMVEFTDPNPFKEIHIGHLYSNTVGEAICRLIESQGADVWRVCYQGDVGMHVAKSIWGILDLKSELPSESASIGEKAAFLGKAYAHGATKFEENESIKEEIVAINKKIYEKDPTVSPIYDQGRRWSLEYFDTVYERMGTKFKKLYFESDAAKVGLKIVSENLDKGVFKKSDGAVVFPGEEYGLHTRVFINSQGLPTYEAKELGLAPTKYADFPYDLSIIITGNEVNEYFKVLLKALEIIEPELGSKTRHMSHGMVRLPSGKMSSRTGKVITGEWLLNEAVARAKAISPDNPDTEKIGLAAVKYAFLKSGIGGDIEFDFDESVSFEGNSGPYLQYTFARSQSLLRKASESGSTDASSEAEYNPEEVRVLRWIYRYPEAVAESASRYAPNLLTNYLYELAQRFNAFYSKHTVVGSDFRIKLTHSVGDVLKSGLEMLGIAALERM